MTLQSAAEALYRSILLPAGSANVLPLSTDPTPRLLVWVDARYLYLLRSTLPRTFDGYPVDIEERPAVTAH